MLGTNRTLEDSFEDQNLTQTNPVLEYIRKIGFGPREALKSDAPKTRRYLHHQLI